VKCIIRDVITGTNGWMWMQDIQKDGRQAQKGGRQAMKCLHDHYDSPSATTHCIQDAKECLKICVYKNKTTFSFEKYDVSVLKECFATLEEDKRAITK